MTRIGLRIGEMSGVNADALRFAFQMTAQDTELGQAELDVEEVSLTCHCPRCDVEFPVVNYDTVCPACQSSETRVTRGDELQVVYLEME